MGARAARCTIDWERMPPAVQRHAMTMTMTMTCFFFEEASMIISARNVLPGTIVSIVRGPSRPK